jgi:NAD+ synthase (glutamine-hydrolysing)
MKANYPLTGNESNQRKGFFYMQITLHQTHHTVADFDNIIKYLENITTPGLHLFPELYLTGYPLLDLCLQKSFIGRYQVLLAQVENLKKRVAKDQVFLMGGLEYKLSEDSLPIDIYNVIYELNSKEFKVVYRKQLLPNYDIFDEQKYFTAGDGPSLWQYQDKKFGLLICEDMWASTFHHKDPVQDLKNLCQNQKIELDGVINLSASPFNIQKFSKRVDRAQYIARLLQAPFIYINRIGGEDEVLFDGQSFICDGQQVPFKLKRFQSDLQTVHYNELPCDFSGETNAKLERSWESLFTARVEARPINSADILHPWTDEECQEVQEALMFGVQEYAQKAGFKNFTVALSGGIDSALVLTLLRLSLRPGQYMEAVYMPSIYSASLSYELSAKLCQNLGVPLYSLPIKFLHSTAKNAFTQTFPQPFEGLTDENIQSRLRGTLLYARSNQINSMVVNTSNKSEIAVGYSTQYGDSVGAISLLGDLYKTEVYALCNYINRMHKNIIPAEIIQRPPTAELRPDQTDAQSLPPYDRLDPMLEGILSYRMDKKDLLQRGFEAQEVEKVFKLYSRSEYKRYQFCPIIKISSKSFGFGYRIPMSKNNTFYL